MSFSSNVLGRRFGQGKESPAPWLCICGTQNASYWPKCPVCHVPRGLSKLAKETP